LRAREPLDGPPFWTGARAKVLPEPKKLCKDVPV